MVGRSQRNHIRILQQLTNPSRCFRASIPSHNFRECHISQYWWVPAVFTLLPAGLLTGGPLQASTGNAWRELERPTPHDLTRLCFLDNLNGWLAGKQGTIIRTTDGGLHWQSQVSNFTSDIVDIFMLDSERGWALGAIRFEDTSTWYGTRILKTTNGGSTWALEPPLGIGKYYNRVLFADSAKGWLCGGYGDLLLTTNGGENWTPADVDSGFRLFWPLLNMRFYSRDVGFAMGGTWDLIGLLWKTTDGGHRWTVHDVSPEPVYDLHFQDSLHILGMVGDLDYGVSIIRTSDGGEHWSYRFLGMMGLPTAIAFRTPAEGWVPLGFPGELLNTTDSGETWNRFTTPRGIPVYDLVFTDSVTGFAVGDSGMVLKYFPTSSDVEGSRLLAAAGRSILGDAYPNPWNSATVISYSLAEEAFIRLKVYDVLGQEVVDPVEERQLAGSHSVVVHGDGLASGIYFYSLEVDGNVTTKRFVLLR
jgi:photosystem II stability/assembly factor-like uncharacterized protein